MSPDDRVRGSPARMTRSIWPGAISRTFWTPKFVRAGGMVPTVELKINFLRPVWQAQLKVEGSVVGRGRMIGYVECNITDEENRLVAKAASTCMVLRGQKATGRWPQTDWQRGRGCVQPLSGSLRPFCWMPPKIVLPNSETERSLLHPITEAQDAENQGTVDGEGGISHESNPA